MDVDQQRDLNDVDVVCKEGSSVLFYEKVRDWLEQSPTRRLFFIEDQVPECQFFSLNPEFLSILQNSRVKIFFLESPLQKEWIAKKIGWLSAFKKLLVIGESWAKLIEWYHMAAHAIVSDAADFGTRVFRHLKINHQKKIRSFSLLKDSMKGIPAVVCGAGPSLEKNGHLLKEWQGKAVLLAAGSAIHSMDVAPDLAISFDPHSPILRSRYFDVPLFMQSRVHPESLKNVEGDLLYFPETHFTFEPWLTQHETPFDSGWTAGTAGVAIAAHLGCNPIVLLGMDYCYQGNRKYAGQKGASSENSLVSTTDRHGAGVWTQKDWLMAIHWMEAFAQSHPEICCINATQDGLNIPGFSNSDFCPTQSHEINIKEKISSLPILSGVEQRICAWIESLKRCYRPDLTPILEEEVAQELLLDPLWRVWQPLFERELMADGSEISMEEKLAIQKNLFFNRVIEEHLSC